MTQHKQIVRGGRALVLGLALAIGSASCGSDDATDSEAPADQTQDSTPVSTADVTTTESSDGVTTTAMVDDSEPVEETDQADADVVIEISVSDGAVTVDNDRVEVPLDSEVVIGVTADVADEVHLHGYDIMADTTPGERTEIRFVADTPGRFEVELESSATFLVEIAVS